MTRSGKAHGQGRQGRRAGVRLAFAGLLLVSLRAAADAPTNPPQYASFTQEDLTIEDRFTQLEWRRVIPTKRTHAEAESYCATTFEIGAWRLPTVKELLTLVDEEPHKEYERGVEVDKYYDQRAFDGSPVDAPYWTSTPRNPVGANTSRWAVSFGTGAPVQLEESSSAYVRCVR